MSQNVHSQNIQSQKNINPTPRDRRSSAAHPAVHPPFPKETGDAQARLRCPRSLEATVDNLMDEVFGDIERMLERGGQLSMRLASEDAARVNHVAVDAVNAVDAIDRVHPGNPEPEATQAAPAETLPSPFSSLALLPKLSPRQLKPNDAPELDDAEDEFNLFPDPPETPPPPNQARPFDHVLLGLAMISLAAAVGLWVFVRTKLPQLTQTGNALSAEDVLQAKHDADFLSYVSRSLERIDRVSKQATPPTESGTTPTALDPLFVPLPPPPSIAITPPVTTAPVAAAPMPSISVSPLPPVAPTTAPSIAPSVPVAAAPTVPSTSPIPNIAASPTHILIGLLELGDRSAALFEIDGAPQRIQVGEKFGGSGWTLISVSGEEAIVRRNGDVRSVFIGQKF